MRLRCVAAIAIACACVALSPSAAAQNKSRPGVAKPRDSARLLAPPDPSVFVAEASRLVQLPRLTEAQIREYISDLVIQLELAKGYRVAAKDFGLRLPDITDKIKLTATVTKQGANTIDVLRFGYVIQPRRLPQLWIYGITVTPAAIEINRDFEPDSLDAVLRSVLSERMKTLSNLSVRDLESRVLTLSYIDAEGALFALRAMGYAAVTDDDPLLPDTAYRGQDVPLLAALADKTAEKPAERPTRNDDNLRPPQPGEPRSRFLAIRHLPGAIDFERLPVIVRMPAPDPKTVGLVGGEAAQTQQRDQLGISLVPQAAAPLSSAVTGATSRLLVLFHPAYPDQFFKVKHIIENVIDKPARQVFIEGLVLEISSEGLRELGVRWDITRGNNQLQLGTLVDVPPGNTFSYTYDSLLIDPRRILSRINALVDENKAEILSRPSVLTLDNRQATIRVGTDIPIATSKDAGTGAAGGRVAFSFQYLPTGILLNVRPRISDNGKEISMLVDATVSATVPNADLTVRDPGTGQVLASAPTISTRRVQTYARIVNNQPLIIGGLVSRDQIQGHERVPGLGDIPVFGLLFGRKSDLDNRREVIIVLTPSLVTEEFRATKWQLPRDDDRFDQFGNVLFRETYRIRAEDLIDSQYLRFNHRLLTYRRIAHEVMARNPDLTSVYPFSAFRDTRVPGEFVFVSGMLSRMLARLKTADPVNIDKLTYFQSISGPEFKTDTLGALLKRLGDGQTHQGFFAKNPGKALMLRFEFGRRSTDPADLLREPLAEVDVIDCPDRETWKELLWKLNQPEDGRQRHYVMLIQDESDLERVKLAIAVKNTILANGNEPAIIFDNFLPGKMLAMQEISPNWERTLEATVARYFFFGELFYPAFSQTLDRAIQDLDATLRRSELAQWVQGITLP